MFRVDGEVVLSPSDLVGFLGCPHSTYLDLNRLEGGLEKTAPDAQEQLLFDKGLELESAYLASLKEQDHSITEIDGDKSYVERAQETKNAISNGYDFIYQATLLEGRWLGIVDFLVSVQSKSDVSSYEPMDVKLARSPAAGHIIQLAVYAELARAVLGHYPESVNLVLSDKSQVHLPSRDFVHYCKNAMRRLELFVREPPKGSYPEPCQRCGQCSWKGDCTELWQRDDHLSLVADIRRSQINKLNDAGIDTVLELSRLPEQARVPKLSEHSFVKLRAQAKLQVSARETGENRYEILPVVQGKGFGRLPEPDPGDIFFDIEGDPLYPEGLEYLFGLYVVDDNQPCFHPFWAHDHSSEREAFQKVIDFIINRLKQHPSACVYHYAHYEETALKRLASRYGTREAELDDLLRNRKLIDLYKVVRDGIRISEPSYSLKNIETFYKGKREGDVATATESIVVYERWRETRDSRLLEEIRSYNEEDCQSTHLLREWLLSIKPEGLPWFEIGFEQTDEEKIESREEAERIRSEYERKLLEVFPADASETGQLSAYLLEFHRREAKPAWWAMFDRQDKSEEELIEDPEALGGLRIEPEPPPFIEKRSTIYTFAFPPQDSKLKVGDGCLLSESLDWAGKIQHLDEDRLILQIKRGNRQDPPPPILSLIPTGPIDDKVLRKAVYRFADAVISGSGRYRAVRALLQRELPAIAGPSPGGPIIDETKDLIPEVFRAVVNLEESYLFIQGPPGAGKTFTASDVIVDLIRTGNKVGVSSNSHKAINNLLAAVEVKSQQKGVSFRGIKKSSGNRPETFFNGDFIEDVTDNKLVDPNADLIAGTAWLFAREELDEVLDYLFIDEAGQVSLANIVAMGLSTKNIVLVGDPMQLAQPIQGVHPGESGQSALEYLLQDRATVSPERGIFLATTWRMHGQLCEFISQAVYDSRLKPERDNQTQRLLLTDSSHSALKEVGLSVVPVQHSGCSQKCEEEVELVREIVSDLLLQEYRGKDGVVRPLNLGNILVVSPYNIQVNHIKLVLPPGARVGTVDKFQGQEAEVVIISMATSSGEDLPRHIEFLYSRNRLNVAISRAKILSVILANPRLLEIQCRTIDQLRLVNTLCWAESYSSEV